MPDFSSFLSRPAGRAVRPPALPLGTYPAVIKGYEYGESAVQKTPYVRYGVVLIGWPDSIPVEKRSYKDREGNLFEIDLSRIRLRRDFFFTEEAYWRLDEFLRSCGVHLEGFLYEEVCPKVDGAQVKAEIQHYVNPHTNEIGNQIGRLYGPNDPN